MSGRYLLDTNNVIAVFSGEAAVQQRLAAAAEVFVASIVLGELYYGVYKSARVAANLVRVGEFAAKSTVLVCDMAAAREYGQIKNGLRAKGRPLPENDIWIAAVAKAHNLTVVTRDARFGEIAGLLLEAW